MSNQEPDTPLEVVDGTDLKPRQRPRQVGASVVPFIAKAVVRTMTGKMVIAGASIFLGLLWAAFQFGDVVRDDELVMKHRLGRLIETPVEPGLVVYWPIIENVYKFNMRRQRVRITDDLGTLPGIDTRSLDGWEVGVTVELWYTLDGAKGVELVENFGRDDSEESRQLMEQRIADEVRHYVKHLMSRYYLDYIRDNRNEFDSNLKSCLGADRAFMGGKQVVLDALVLGSNATEGDDLLVLRPEPLADETLAGIGIDVVSLSVDFQTPKKYDLERERQALSLQRRKTALQEKRALTEERALLKEQLAVAQEMAAKDMVAVREEIAARATASAFHSAVEKWDGRLPSALIVGEELLNLQEIQRLFASAHSSDLSDRASVPRDRSAQVPD